MAEAPGENEVNEGIPLVGWTGVFVNEALNYYGFPREHIRVENTFQGKAQYTKKAGKLASLHCGPSLWQVIKAMPNLRTVLALGEASLRELSGYRQWDQAFRQADAEHKRSTRQERSWIKRRAKAAESWTAKLSKREAQETLRREKYETKLAVAQAKFNAKQSKQRELFGEGGGGGSSAKPAKVFKPPATPKPLKPLQAPAILGEAKPVPSPPPNPKPVGCKGISNYRGSPLWVAGLEGKVRLFPVIHPAAAAPKRQPKLRPLILHDIRRAVEFHKGLRQEQVPDIVITEDPARVQDWWNQWVGLTEPGGRKLKVAIDLEWSRVENELVSIQLAVGVNCLVILFAKPDGWRMPPLVRGAVFKLLQEFFDNPTVEWGGHFVSGYDQHKLEQLGLHLNPVWDSLYSFHILHPDLGSSKDEDEEKLGKKKASAQQTGYDLGFVTSVLTDMPYHKGVVTGTKDALSASSADLAVYGARDAMASWIIQDNEDREGDKQLGFARFREFLADEMDLARRANKMSRRGLPILDDERQRRQSQWEGKQLEIQDRARSLTGIPTFNIGSGPQLAKQLIARGLPVKINKDTNNPMLDGNEVQKLIARFPNEPLLSLAKEDRTANKEANAYAEMTPWADGFAHPSWKVHGTVGTRWSATPNYQNKTYVQREVIGLPGGYIIGGDLDSAELRVLAWLAQDKPFLDILAKGEKPHQQTCMMLFGREYPKDSDEYKFAKAFTFRMFYTLPGRPPTTGGQLRLTKGPVTEDRLAFFAKKWEYGHPAIVRWKRNVIAELHRTHKVTNIFGRYRDLSWGLFVWAKEVVEHVEQAALNFSVQTVIGTVINRAFKRLDTEVDSARSSGIIQGWPVLQCHDELACLAMDESELPWFATALRQAIEQPIDEMAGYVIPAEIKAGPTWGQMKGYQ